MEITCGEGPYLTSRYDLVAGTEIPLHDRIGLLDRKFRVISENAADRNEWIKWAVRAIQATYGFDAQGDNVLLARENLLYDFCENYEAFINGRSFPHVCFMSTQDRRIRTVNIECFPYLRRWLRTRSVLRPMSF